MQQLPLDWLPQRRTYTVGELTAEIRALLNDAYQDIWVSGEISGAKQASSGHFYFSLKDQEAKIDCVVYRGTARFLKFKPRDGVAVLARGRVDVYDQRGQYQLIVEVLEPRGFGALQLAFEQLKKKLAEEGLFDAARKRPLPPLPARIGIVTSPQGAVIQDMLNILLRRFPGIHIRLYPALVQGEGSVEQIVRGIQHFSKSAWAQAVIVARGGGSLEDLWSFNDESVARAIAGCPVPVISAVGHETDFTIADFVADLRAPTPSAAAELVVPTRESLEDRIGGCERKLLQGARLTLAYRLRRLHQQGIEKASTLMHRRIGRSLQRVDDAEYRLRVRSREEIEGRRRALAGLQNRLLSCDVRVKFQQAHRRLDAAGAALARCVQSRLTASKSAFAPLEAHLTQLSPLRVLERGYAIVQKTSGELVKSPRMVKPGEPLAVRLAGGTLDVLAAKRK
ncbi:MAG: exodeoxyribonuclease VII large subunit [Bryobacteraceae bacterium]|nr:exodeoxyribonuclease VII large subunit [Bryobacteraceae bacterium]